MGNQHALVEIKEFVKRGKQIIIELDDDVEYIVDDEAVASIVQGKQKVNLIRVIDRTPRLVTVRRIQWAIFKNGVIDYIDVN